ncbi:tetratricopeptide repeat protein [Flavobacteriaceae bacterium]|nr:tetratricopeptide repeat protein [Flavobacteriaceae bacterium]
MKKLLIISTFMISHFFVIGQTTDYYSSALEKYDNDDYYGAIADFTKAIEIDNEDYLAYNFRGLSKARVGDSYGAIVDFRNAIRLQPNNPQWTHYFYDNMGVCMMNLEDYKGAINCFDKSIQLNPDIANPYLNRGNCKWNLNYEIQDCCKDWRLAAYRGSKSAQEELRRNCN